jgi:hypothetical protein
MLLDGFVSQTFRRDSTSLANWCRSPTGTAPTDWLVDALGAVVTV